MSRLSRAVRKSWLYRRVFPPRLPQALVIGAQKSGTSALFSYLGQHPRCCPSSEKEDDFFTSESRYRNGPDWYAAHWDQRAAAKSIRLEASPHYLMVRAAAARIRADLPHVRLIAILRDPVARAWSAWQMYRRQLANDPQFYDKFYRARFTAEERAELVRRAAAEFDDFWLAIRREAGCLERGQRMQCSVLEFGLYGPQLQRYLDLWPRQQLLVLDSDNLRARRVSTLNRVLE